MSEHETERDDSEVEAMLAIVKYLAPLDRGACNRVLKWAEDRFVSESASTLDPKFMTKFTDAITDAARQIGKITPLDIINLVNECSRVRGKAELESSIAEGVT